MSNYLTAQRLSQDSTCKGVNGETCTRKIEASRFLYSLNKRVNFPELCDLCAFKKKNPLPSSKGA